MVEDRISKQYETMFGIIADKSVQEKRREIRERLSYKKSKQMSEKYSFRATLRMFKTLFLYEYVDVPDEDGEDPYYYYIITRICYWIIQQRWFATLMATCIVINTSLLSTRQISIVRQHGPL